MNNELELELLSIHDKIDELTKREKELKGELTTQIKSGTKPANKRFVIVYGVDRIVYETDTKAMVKENPELARKYEKLVQKKGDITIKIVGAKNE